MTIGIKKPNKDGVITYYGETDLQGYFFKDFDASSADSNVAWSINELVAISNQKKGCFFIWEK